MIYYSKDTAQEIPVGTGVQVTDGVVEPHSSGELVGFIRANSPLEGDTGFRAQIYVAGGGGSPMLLGASWDGSLKRFDVINGRAVPVSQGGVGWLVPEYPPTNKNAGDLVLGALYT